MDGIKVSMWEDIKNKKIKKNASFYIWMNKEHKVLLQACHISHLWTI